MTLEFLGLQPQLDGKHTAPGKVVSGMNAINAIRQGDIIIKVAVIEA